MILLLTNLTEVLQGPPLPHLLESPSGKNTTVKMVLETSLDNINQEVSPTAPAVNTLTSNPKEKCADDNDHISENCTNRSKKLVAINEKAIKVK